VLAHKTLWIALYSQSIMQAAFWEREVGSRLSHLVNMRWLHLVIPQSI
jgi:hypothetical protein